ncbi:hypothetical protein Q8A67_021553 [Cirrhinus molitorella]|uniref:Uncharacterized protein n=1 Tax=Cirrhinus molitorella TaxID=172907 RepID=A0AA88PAY2_9TELE|nr:hypothetical protein Q8A67_021553 [Cirrhinus molitorella]
MNVNWEEYYRSVFNEELSSCIKALETESPGSTVRRPMEKDEVEAQRKELQMRRERLKEREENLKKEQEELRQYKLENQETLQKNKARQLKAIQTTNELEGKNKEIEEDIKGLTERYKALLAQKDLLLSQRKLQGKHQETTAKVEDTGRDSECGGTQSIREEILERRANAEKEAEREKQKIIKEINDRRTLILHYNNIQQQQQRELEEIRSETRKWELKREELRSTAEREKLQYAQIKVGIHSIYKMIAPCWKASVEIADPYEQLELIRKHLQLLRAIADKDGSQRGLVSKL